MRRIALALLLLAGLTRGAGAHQSTSSYSDIAVGADGVVDWELRLSTRDLYEALALEADRDATDDEVRRGEDALFAYVLARVRVASVAPGGETPCPAERRGLRIASELGERRAGLRFVARCPGAPGPVARVALRYDLFFDLDPRHTGYARIRVGLKAIIREFHRGSGRLEWELAGPPPASAGLLDFLAEGVDHIYTGYDHIAFLVGLLLIAAVRRGDGGRWEPRGLKVGVLYVVKIVTAFTVAHSLTLIAAAVDWIHVPPRFVEAAIAASIVYVAVENVLSGDPRFRWPLAFGFGLVHGMGFAASLRPLLPPSGVVIPLLTLNVGVELGQLSIVVLLYPLLHAVARGGGGVLYRRAVVLCGSGIVGLVGARYLVERLLDVKLPPSWLG